MFIDKRCLENDLFTTWFAYQKVLKSRQESFGWDNSV